MNMATQAYVGSELELFAQAIKWKSYFREQLKPYLGAYVLEVGAGIGGTTRVLCDGKQQSWVCLEPDPELAAQIKLLIGNNRLPSCCQVAVGTLTSVDDRPTFDTILYVDVLEHIKDDADELQAASRPLERRRFDSGVVSGTSMSLLTVRPSDRPFSQIQSKNSFGRFIDRF
jgi:cyclopropane fatty-acyl-phospholipid synthase-like methyltransferase